MAPRSHPSPSETQSLIQEQARRFREMQVDTLESHEDRIESLERDRANFKGRAAVVIAIASIVGSGIVSVVIHMLTQYFGLHK